MGQKKHGYTKLNNTLIWDDEREIFWYILYKLIPYSVYISIYTSAGCLLVDIDTTTFDD